MTKSAPTLDRVVIINDASLARGGATGLALLEARGLKKIGIQVTYICGDAGDSSLLDQGIDVIALGERPLVAQSRVGAATGGIFRKATVQMIADWIAVNDSPGTVYHVHGWSKILSPSVFVPLRKTAARTFIHAHDFFLACPNGAYMDYQHMEPCSRVPLGLSCLATHCDKRSRAQKLWRSSRQVVLGRTFNRHADWAGIFCLHEAMHDGLVRSGVADGLIQTVRNPAVPFSGTRIDAENNERLLFVGRVEQEKGIEQLVEAATTLGIPLTVAGDGPLLESLKKQYPDVVFAGWSNRTSITEYARKARALVMPSHYPEPFGLVAAEAALSGLPVIITNRALLAEEFVERGIGLATATDSAALQAALKTIRDASPADITTMSQRAVVAKSLCHTPDGWIDKLREIFAKSLEQAG